MAANEIFIYGASGHGKVIADIVRICGYKIGGWIDDRPIEDVYSWDSFCSAHPNAQIALGVGDNHTRESLFRKITNAGYFLPVLIHPSAIISPSAVLDNATVVMPLAIINADTHIEQGCIINSGAVIEHDCQLEAFVHISPKVALAGNVRVGHHTHIGIGSSVIQSITIGSDTIIGAGSVVIHNIPSCSLAVGIPASVRKKQKQT